MARVFTRDTLYRTYLEEYSETWQEFVKFRRENGILEIRFHIDDGPWRWNEPMHGALVLAASSSDEPAASKFSQCKWPV